MREFMVHLNHNLNAIVGSISFGRWNIRKGKECRHFDNPTLPSMDSTQMKPIRLRLGCFASDSAVLISLGCWGMT